LKDRPGNGGKEYLVRWLGYSSQYDSWQPVVDLINENGVCEALEIYLRKQNAAEKI
jgi:hypothetical protein